MILSRVEICELEVPLIVQNEKLSGTLKQIPPPPPISDLPHALFPGLCHHPGFDHL